MGTHLQSLKSNVQNVNTRKNKTKMAEQDWAEEVVAEAAEEMAMEEDLNEPKLFGKWDLSEVQCKDMALADYIKFDKANAKYLPHNSSRFNKTRFRKAQCHIVERLVNAFMQKGRNNGEDAFDANREARIRDHPRHDRRKPRPDLRQRHHERRPKRRLNSNRSSRIRATTGLRRFANATSEPGHLAHHNWRQERRLPKHQDGR